MVRGTNMETQIKCKYNKGIGCSCPNVKRTLWGMGARLCVEIENNRITSTKCQFKEEHTTPVAFNALNNTISQQEIRIIELENTLQYYADTDTYIPYRDSETISLTSSIEWDMGSRARKTLYGDET